MGLPPLPPPLRNAREPNWLVERLKEEVVVSVEPVDGLVHHCSSSKYDSLLSPLCLYTAQHSNKKAEDVCVFVEERREERRGETLKQKQTTRRLLFLLGLERRGLELLQEFAAAASAAAVVVAPSEKATQIHRSSSSSSSSLCLH